MAIPGFFKIFLSHFSSESMVIPASYYDELPLVLPKTALLQGSTGGCFWKVAMFKRRDEVYFGKGWAKFVEDNRLSDGDVMTFVYDGSRNFKVSIYSGSRACKEVRAVAQVITVEDGDDIEDTNTSSEPDMSQTVPISRNQVYTSADDSNIIEPEVAKRVPRTRNKVPGKKRVVVVEYDESFITEDSNSMSDDDSSYSPPNEDTLLDVTPKVTNSRKKGELRSVNSNVGATNTSSEPEMAQTVPNARNQLEDSNIIEPEVAQRVPRTRNKGKKRVVVVADSDESFISEDSSSMSEDSSYSPPNEDSLLDVTPKVTNSRKKEGELRSVNSNVGSTSNSSRSVSRKRHYTIKNPEVYLDDPMNVCFETIVKNRIYELTVPSQIMKDYCLKFQDYVWYIDNHKKGKVAARAATWQDQRVCIKKWERIVQRNALKKGDRLLCELFRKDGLVYAIKIHFVNTTSS